MCLACAQNVLHFLQTFLAVGPDSLLGTVQETLAIETLQLTLGSRIQYNMYVNNRMDD